MEGVRALLPFPDEADMITSEKIYSRDAKGTLRFWFYEVEGDKWRGVSGVDGGAETRSGWVVCTPKSQDTAEEQAQFEAAAEEKKKLDRLYRRDPADLGDVYIKPMLAQEYDKLKKPLTFPVWTQPKLDGIRAIIHADGAFTRQGKEIVAIPHILEALAGVFAEHPDLILDGELYNHEYRNDFNSLGSAIRKTKLDDEVLAQSREVVQYHVYDIVDPSASFDARTDRLAMILAEIDTAIIRDVETILVSSQENLDTLLEQWLLEEYEGQMVRLVDGVYEQKRSKQLLKRKDFVTKEFKLLRIEEGIGNWAGKAKRVVFEMEDGRECEGGVRGTYEFCAALLANKEHYEGGEVTIRSMRQRTPDGFVRMGVAVDFHPNGRQD